MNSDERVNELLLVLYRITAAEDPKEMYDLAVDTLKEYGVEPAPLNV